MSAERRYRPTPVTAAKLGMFRTSDRIDEANGYDGVRKVRAVDPVALADARTSMCDYRVALAIALGRSPDRNGYFRAEVTR